jgi:hypothetical protein
MEHSPSCEADSHSASQEISPPFMEPEGLSPCSKDPTTSSYPDPDATIPLLRTLIPQEPF